MKGCVMALNKPRKRVVAAIATAVFLASGLTVSMTADSSAATVPNRFWCKPSGVGGGWCYRVNKYAPGAHRVPVEAQRHGEPASRHALHQLPRSLGSQRTLVYNFGTEQQSELESDKTSEIPSADNVVLMFILSAFFIASMDRVVDVSVVAVD